MTTEKSEDAVLSSPPKFRRNGSHEPPTDRLPPHEMDAEMAVIGCCILEPEKSIPKCEEKLVAGASVFFDLRHQIIYQRILGMNNLGEDIDSITLGASLGGKLTEIGGRDYLNQCQDKVLSTANLENYLDILVEKMRLRKIIATCADVVGRAYNHSGNLDSLLEVLEKNVLSVQSENQPKEILNGKESCRRMSDDLERRMNLKGALSGLDTGLVDLNRKIEGLQFGEQFVVGSRPSQGKTALALTVFAHMAIKLKVPSLFISLEMCTEALMRRLLSLCSNTPLATIKRGTYSEQEIQRFIVWQDTFMKSPMFIVDGVSGTSCREIIGTIRRMVLLHGIKFVAIDYLQKVKSDIKQEKKTYELADVSGKLKAVATETNVAMMTLAQLNRENTKDKGRAPRLSDLADCGQIERDADTVALIHREKDQSALIIAKQRDGEIGLVPIFFNGMYCRFENASRAEEPETPWSDRD